ARVPEPPVPRITRGLSARSARPGSRRPVSCRRSSPRAARRRADCIIKTVRQYSGPATIRACSPRGAATPRMHSSQSSISTGPAQGLALGLMVLGPLAGGARGAPGRARGGAEAATAAPGQRPNIVLIQTDDQTYRQFSRQVMPNTKRLLVNHGTTFRNYIATT